MRKMFPVERRPSELVDGSLPGLYGGESGSSAATDVAESVAVRLPGVLFKANWGLSAFRAPWCEVVCGL